MKISNNRKFRFIAGILISLIFLYLTIGKLSLAELNEIISNASILPLTLAVIFFFVGYLLRAKRWEIMLEYKNEKICYHKCVKIIFITTAMNNVLPLRAGDIARVMFYNKEINKSTSSILASMVIERFLDLFCILFFLWVSLFFVKIPYTNNITQQLPLLGCFCILLLLIKPQVYTLTLHFFSGLLKKTANVNLSRFEQGLNNFTSLVNNTSSLGITSKLLVLSLIAWSFEALVFYITSLSIIEIINNKSALFAMPIGTFSTLIPGSPGYFGTFDYFVSQTMKISGNNATIASAYALLVHVVIWLPITVAGGIMLILKGKNNV